MLKRIFFALVEMVYWLAIWLSPVLLFSGIGFVLYLYYPKLSTVSLVLAGIGVIVGIILAEYIRRTYGCSKFLSSISSTPDVWPDEDKR